MTPFDFLNEINFGKKNLMDEDPNVEKLYTPFMVNRGLSYFPDTVIQANEMNSRTHLDNRLQYDFLMTSISKRKRFSKWAKKDKKTEDLELISKLYKYNTERALEALSILTEEQLETIRSKNYKGGKS